MAEPGIVVIHEEQAQYRMDEAALEEGIKNIQENRRAYTEQAYYLESLQMMQVALAFLKEHS